MKNFLKKTTSIVLAGVILVSCLGYAYADNISDLKQQQQDIQNKTKKAKDLLNETKNIKDATLTEVIELDALLDEATQNYYKTSTDLENTTALLEKTEAELKQAETDYDQQYDTFKKRIRFMYENGDMSYLDILFKAENFSDFLNSLDYIERIINYDNNMVSNLKATKELIKVKVEETEIQKMETELLKEEYEVQKSVFEDMVYEKQMLVNQLTVDIDSFDSQVKNLEAADQEVQNLIKKAEEEAKKRAEEERARIERELAAKRKAQAEAEAAKAKKAQEAKASGSDKISTAETSSSSSQIYNGTLGWPVEGSYTRTSEYGFRIHPISKKKEMHTGVDIKASTGTNVLAAADGVVISATYMNGYGNTVIIDHGDNISTLYAHNSQVVVTTGETVVKGQVVAKAGSSGYSTGPHLHFEVRVNGRHTSPKKYLGY